MAPGVGGPPYLSDQRPEGFPSWLSTLLFISCDSAITVPQSSSCSCFSAIYKGRGHARFGGGGFEQVQKPPVVLYLVP